MQKSAKDIDAYLASQPKEVRIALEKLRQIIKSVVPEAEEMISYQMPAFKYHGMLVGFAGWKNHCGFYPWNSSTIKKFKNELKEFGTSKGAIRFTIEKPLPDALIKKMVASRIQENLSKEKKLNLTKLKQK
jgi:uncharacterized protein YdhG (YjbR/CyaY superfamily)